MQSTPAPMDILRRIDDARPKIISSLNALKLSHNGPEAREQLVKCISTTSNVTETLRHVAPMSDEAIRLLTELAQLFDRPPTPIKKITSRLDYHDHKAVEHLDHLREFIQSVLDKLEPHLRSADAMTPTSANQDGRSEIETETSKASSSKPEDKPPWKSLKWEMILEPSKKVLDAVSKASPLIPIVGPFIQCGVDSVSTLIDMIQGSSDNDDDAKRLCEKVKRLSDMMATFKDDKRPYSSEGVLAGYLESLKKHCDAAKEDAQKMLKQWGGRKIVFSETSAGDLADLEKNIDAAVADLELYLGLDVHRMIQDQGENYFADRSVSLALLGYLVEHQRLIDRLGDAKYGNNSHRKKDGLCLDGTRVDILRKADTWADDLSSPKALLLKGQAGRGKSTTAKTVTSRFRERWGNKASCALFHFRHDNKDLDRRPLLALARQLASDTAAAEPQVRNALLQAIKDHPDVADACLEGQFDILFVQALKKPESYTPRVLFIIDALDECADPKLIASLLQLIAKACPSLPSSVKFLFTSRPELPIVRKFQAFKEYGREENLDTVGVAVIDNDLRTYFLQRLRQIRSDCAIGDSWLAEDSVDDLVSLSEGLFQWADTAMSYVEGAPEANLQELVDSRNVIVGLGSLYKQILSKAFPSTSDVKDVQLPKLLEHVLGSLVVASHPVSPAVLAYLWNDSTEAKTSLKSTLDIFKVLNPLRSMLVLPNEQSPESPIHFMHTSVRDFLATGKFQYEDFQLPINAPAQHRRLANICFRRMERDLKHDICEVNDPSKMNSEVLDLVEKHIPSGLRYCCRSWSIHFSETKGDGNAGLDNVRKKLDEFCAQRLLHWLEVLSLIGALSEVFDMIRQTRDWLKLQIPPSETGGQTTSLLGDTGDLCRRFFKPMSINAQHINLSFLLQFPDNTPLRRSYVIGQQVPRVIRGPPPSSDQSRAINTGSHVLCAVVSPDGKTVGAGLSDYTIRLWDLDSGELKGEPLVGHTDLVTSVAFAPDGKTLASGSDDKSIRLWNVATGELKGEPLVGHTNPVTSIAFAPDGNTLASGSDDESIRLWNVATGELKGEPLVGHTDLVTSVAFAPNGKTVASGLRDESIRLWNVATGQLKGEPLVGHTEWVTSVAFAPDGNTLISRSWRQAIHWRLGDGPPMPIQAGADQNVTDNNQPGPPIRLGGQASEPDEQGWVFINAKPCFWLPEDFYMDNRLDFRGERVHFQVEITLFGTILVLHHHNIHIIDVSAFL